jgi:hypothetical protein
VFRNFGNGNISGLKKSFSVASVHGAKKQLKLRPYRFQSVHQLQHRDTAAKIKNFHWFRRFVGEGVHVLQSRLRLKLNTLCTDN